MNLLEKIRSCFWQSDDTERQHVVISASDESVQIKKTEQEQEVQELDEQIIEMMIPVMMMSKVFWSFFDEIVKSAEQFHIEYSLVDNVAYCEGEAKDVKKFEALLQKIHNTIVGGEEKRMIFHGDDSSRKRNWEDQDFVVPQDWTRENVDVALEEARKKELHFLYRDHALKIRGNKFDLSMFSQWFEEFTNERKKQKQDFKKFLMNLKRETITEKFQIDSDGKVLPKQDISTKASLLEIDCSFYEDDNVRSWNISGRADRVKSFKSYLQAINPTFPKGLYPKYWDFDVQEDYAEIKVSPESKEFEEIRLKFCSSLHCAVLTKVIRVQNQGLMKSYLTTICGQNSEDERVLLFYGTEIQEPEKIYKYSKIGFDLSYASSKRKFGKGFYFPITALYAHGCAYKPIPTTFQVILADVFAQNTFIVTTADVIPNIPKGYDSLLDPDNVYVIYKNSQSYPLYLVEYTLELSNVNFPSEEQKKATFREEKRGDTREKEFLPPPRQRPYNPREEAFEGPSVMCLRRVARELEILKNDLFIRENFLVDPLDTEKLNEWIVYLIGPPTTPYEGGLFKISITFPPSYPVDAPKIEFKTRIYHPCITSSGQIRMQSLEDWTPTRNIIEILTHIYCLLGDPTNENPCKGRGDQYKNNKDAFDEKARAWTKLYA